MANTAAFFLALILILSPPNQQRNGTNQRNTRDIANVVEALKKELEPISAEREKLVAEQAQLAEEYQRLIATKELLEGAIRRYKTDAGNLEVEAAGVNTAVQRHNDYPCTYPKDQPEKCASYDQEAQHLNGQQRQIKERRETMEIRRKGLNERWEDLSRATSDWTSRNKTNDNNLYGLDARELNLLNKWTRTLGISAQIKSLEELIILADQCKDVIKECQRGCSDEKKERMKWCTNVSWDNASPSLPPLRNPKPSKGVTATPRP